jgi:hypothetical protein
VPSSRDLHEVMVQFQPNYEMGEGAGCFGVDRRMEKYTLFLWNKTRRDIRVIYRLLSLNFFEAVTNRPSLS